MTGGYVKAKPANEGKSMYNILASATLRVECGPSSGSGFHLGGTDIVVTNAHVIEPFLVAEEPILGIAEDGAAWPLKVLASSPEDKYDYAILSCDRTVPANRTFLQADDQARNDRGEDVLFSGFPHGIHDLLIHNAIISGKIGANGFYIDGTVNGGNSGGPIIRKSDGKLIGIVTQRRFLGAKELEDISKQAESLMQHCKEMAGRGRVVIMGVDYGAFADLMSRSLNLMVEVLHLNANTGIGIGFHPRHVVAECKRLGIPY